MANSSEKSSAEMRSPIATSQDLGWESIVVEEFQNPSGSSETSYESDHIVCLSLATRPNRIWQATSDRSYMGVYTKGDLTILPAELTSSYRAYGEDHHLQIAIPPQFLKQIATETISTDPDRLELITEFCVRNPKIEQLAMMLRTELHQGNSSVGQLYVESLANALTVNLLRDYSATKLQIATYPGGLSDRQILQVTDHIKDRLTESIKIKDLAKFLGISQFHFSRLFKKSTGIAPHQYVMQQRIELAKQLLEKSDIPIADIALNCGFNSQSHLGRYFRAITGMTPRAYRQDK
ncbi:MAG: AraC family transcriptional regulator [Cyanobacteria bacterium J06638_38]